MENRFEKLAATLLEPEAIDGAYDEVFEALGFGDHRKASTLWKKLLPPTGLEPAAARHAEVLISELVRCPDPDMALLNLSRYLEMIVAPSSFLSSLFLERPLCHMLVLIFSCSYHLSDVLVRNPGYLSWLIEQNTLEQHKPYSEYRAELIIQNTTFHDRHRRLNSIKRYRRREMLRIGARDLLGLAPVEEITAELTFLADAVIETVASLSFEEEMEAAGRTGERWDTGGRRPFHRFAVCSLGKLGGTELNYSSDIDLLYICETEGGDESAFYTSLSQRITNLLAEPTGEGTLYRVDLRLRPDGESGPLVSTLQDHMNYLMRRAHPWERQALLKARHSAGNRSVSERFKENCDRVIYSSISSGDPLEEILLMRERAVMNLPPGERERNIKLMSGGIRDIEFIAQALQLVHGQSRPETRSRNTMEALERLHHYGIVSDDVLESLCGSYRLFRTIEHRLQMLRDAHTHTLPDSGAELQKLAERTANSALEHITSVTFPAEVGKAVRSVQQLFHSFFRERSAGEVPLLLSLPPGEKEVNTILSRYGIGEGKQAHRFLWSLAYGDFPRLEGPETLQAAVKSLPVILDAVSKTPAPALTLKNLTGIVKATGAVRSTMELLSAGGDFLRLFLNVSAHSTMLSAILRRRIEILDVLAEGLRPGSLVERMEAVQAIRGGAPVQAPLGESAGADGELSLREITRWYEEILLSIHCSHPIPENGPETLGPLYSDALEQVLRALFELNGGHETGAAIFTLGSLGGRQCRFGSDIDLIAVVPDDGSRQDAAHVLQRMAEDTRTVHLAPVDMRLRGEGSGSPLVQPIAYYEKYLDERADLWEHLALSKHRFLCGDKDTGNMFRTLVSKAMGRIKRGTGLASGLKKARGKLESLSKGPWDVKHAPGGLYDIGFITGSAAITLPGASVRSLPLQELLPVLEDNGLIDHDDISTLTRAAGLYYLVKHAAALHGISYPPLPEREAFIGSYLHNLLGIEPCAEAVFTEYLGERRRGVRRVFERYIERLGAFSG